MLSRLYLIRHGETEWSISGHFTSRTDLPLTANGEEMARRVGERLQAVRFAHVFTSPRQRARRTCELAGLGATAVVEPDLAEWDYGDFEGLPSSAVHAARPLWNLFEHGCPGGETPDQVGRRADRLLARLRDLSGNIAVFSHGHSGRVLAARWVGLTVAQAGRFLFDPASLGVLDYEHGLRQSPVIALWNSPPSPCTPPIPDALVVAPAPAPAAGLDPGVHTGSLG